MLLFTTTAPEGREDVGLQLQDLQSSFETLYYKIAKLKRDLQNKWQEYESLNDTKCLAWLRENNTERLACLGDTETVTNPVEVVNTSEEVIEDGGNMEIGNVKEVGEASKSMIILQIHPQILMSC